MEHWDQFALLKKVRWGRLVHHYRDNGNVQCKTHQKHWPCRHLRLQCLGLHLGRLSPYKELEPKSCITKISCYRSFYLRIVGPVVEVVPELLQDVRTVTAVMCAFRSGDLLRIAWIRRRGLSRLDCGARKWCPTALFLAGLCCCRSAMAWLRHLLPTRAGVRSQILRC